MNEMDVLMIGAGTAEQIADSDLTSTVFLDLETMPEQLALVGGSFVSLEFAHFAARLGVRREEVYIPRIQ